MQKLYTHIYRVELRTAKRTYVEYTSDNKLHYNSDYKVEYTAQKTRVYKRAVMIGVNTKVLGMAKIYMYFKNGHPFIYVPWGFWKREVKLREFKSFSVTKVTKVLDLQDYTLQELRNELKAEEFIQFCKDYDLEKGIIHQ